MWFRRRHLLYSNTHQFSIMWLVLLLCESDFIHFSNFYERNQNVQFLTCWLVVIYLLLWNAKRSCKKMNSVFLDCGVWCFVMGLAEEGRWWRRNGDGWLIIYFKRWNDEVLREQREWNLFHFSIRACHTPHHPPCATSALVCSAILDNLN